MKISYIIDEYNKLKLACFKPYSDWSYDEKLLENFLNTEVEIVKEKED